MAGPDPAPGAPSYRLAGIIGFGASVLILRLLPLRFTLALVHLLGCRMPPANVEQAEAGVNGVRRASRYYPGRAVCMETSLAAVLAGLLHLHRAQWCIGGRTLPYAAHAWVEADNTPVGENADRPYQVFVRV
jgi:hypothetical protein